MATPSKDSVKKLTNVFKEVLKSPTLEDKAEDLSEAEKMNMVEESTEEPEEASEHENLDTKDEISQEANDKVEDLSEKMDEGPTEKTEEPEVQSEIADNADENPPGDINEDPQEEQEPEEPEAESSDIPNLRIESIQAEVSWDSEDDTPDKSFLGNIIEKLDSELDGDVSENMGYSTQEDGDVETFTETFTMAVTMEAGDIEKLPDSDQVVMNLNCQETKMDTDSETPDKSVAETPDKSVAKALDTGAETPKKEESKEETAADEPQEPGLRQSCPKPVVVLQDIRNMTAATVTRMIMAGKKSARKMGPKSKMKKAETEQDAVDDHTSEPTTVTVTLSVSEVEVLSDHGHVMMHIGCQETEDSDVPVEDASETKMKTTPKKIKQQKEVLKRKSKIRRDSLHEDQKKRKKKSLSEDSHIEDRRPQRGSSKMKGKKGKRALSRETISDKSDSEDESLESLPKKNREKQEDFDWIGSKNKAKGKKKTKHVLSRETISDSSDSEDGGSQTIHVVPQKKGKKIQTKPVSSKEIVSEASEDELVSPKKAKKKAKPALSKGTISDDSGDEKLDISKKKEKKKPKRVSSQEIVSDHSEDEDEEKKQGLASNIQGKKGTECMLSQKDSVNEGQEELVSKKTPKRKSRRVSSISEDSHVDDKGLKGQLSEKKGKKQVLSKEVPSDDSDGDYQDLASMEVMSDESSVEDAFPLQTSQDSAGAKSASEAEDVSKDAESLDKKSSQQTKPIDSDEKPSPETPEELKKKKVPTATPR